MKLNFRGDLGPASGARCPTVAGMPPDVDDMAASRAAAAKSELSIDVVHRRFKRHWDRKSMETLRIDPAAIPHLEGCELLFEGSYLTTTLTRSRQTLRLEALFNE